VGAQVPPGPGARFGPLEPCAVAYKPFVDCGFGRLPLRCQRKHRERRK
jgi:hypothetical protein